MLTFTLILALSAMARAAPKPCKTTTSYTTATANFDDLGSTAIPRPYVGLDYTSFQVGNAVSSFITPASGSQFAIAYGIPGNATVDQTIFDSIMLKSLFYACDMGIPQPACDVHVDGVPADKKAPVISTTLAYPAQTPAPAGSYRMKKAKFGPEWTGLRKLRFSATEAGTSETFNGGLTLDEVVYVGAKVGCA